jgi:hypothetical protein
MTPHAKYDTACTIDERFERPWQPLKGMSMRCGVSDTACTIFAFENRSYLGEFESEFKKALSRESGAQVVLFYKKKPRVKNLVTLSR